MGRKKLGETTVLRITLPPDAPPDMVDLFKEIMSKKSPMETMRFLHELSQGQPQTMKVTQTDEEKIEQSILTQLKHSGRAHIDDLIRQSGFPTSQVSAQLMMMELMGAVKRLAGNFYLLSEA